MRLIPWKRKALTRIHCLGKRRARDTRTAVMTLHLVPVKRKFQAEVNDQVNKSEKKRKKGKLELNDDDDESQVVKKKNKAIKDHGELTKVTNSLQKNVIRGQKEPEREELTKMNNGEERDYKKEKEKKQQQKKHDDDDDTEVIRSLIKGKVVGNEREELDANIIDKAESTRRDKNKKKKKQTASKERSVRGHDGSNASSTANMASDGKLKANAEGRNRDERRRMEEKRGSDNGGYVVMDIGTNENAEVSNEREFLNGIIMETVADAKETNKKKKKKHTVDSDVAPEELTLHLVSDFVGGVR